MGPTVDAVRDVLDIGDDAGEWLANLLGTSLGLFNTIVTLVADHFASQNAIYEVEDPFPILGYEGALIPVKVPLRNIDVRLSEDEVLISFDVGA